MYQQLLKLIYGEYVDSKFFCLDVFDWTRPAFELGHKVVGTTVRLSWQGVRVKLAGPPIPSCELGHLIRAKAWVRRILQRRDCIMLAS